MAKTVLLNSRDHRELRVKTERSAELGDAVMYCTTFAGEFRNVQAYYPILFQKYPDSDKYGAVALFGMEQGENVFLNDDGWDAGYIPLMQQRIPFSIGMYEDPEGQQDSQRMVHVDLEHPRVAASSGEALFSEQGKETAYLERISSILEAIHTWRTHDDVFNRVLTELDLLEPVTLDVTTYSGKQGQLVGFYSINEEKLAQLGSEDLHGLHQNGFLEPIYMVLASMSNMRGIALRKK